MDIQKAKNIYIVGAGGIGLSALANLLHHQGKIISGSEIVKSEITEHLESKGIEINDQQIQDNITNHIDILIYTAAVDETNPEIIKAKELGIEILSYPEALGQFSNDYTLIAISGTHGKSTVTAMLSKILIEANLDPTIVIGTKTKELNSQNYRLGKSKLMLIEACEYKGSFLNFSPDILVINNLEADHLDHFKTEENYFKTFNKFLQNLKPNGTIIAPSNALEKLEIPKKAKTIHWNKTDTFDLQIPGKFNQENAQSAQLVSRLLDISDSNIKDSLKDFSGSWRRMEIKETKYTKTIFIDDYAHHPTEIKATLKAIRSVNPNKKILAIFQPHQFSRTQYFLNDFAKSFKNCNTVIIPNIYKVRDSQTDISAVSADILVDMINQSSKNALRLNGLEKTAQFIQNNHSDYDIIITMGAGDITNIYDYL